ncbi:MAG: hypothetical protein APF76_03825 [Desulfitibacter sp. BRH_c19]|nr:MAG: hypothetical protein APF76_03825 [Desulfitibacter sp. BRH_c19]
MIENPSNPCLKDLLNEKPIVISQLLLMYYAEVDMDEIELAVVMQLIRFRDCLGQTYPTIDELKTVMTLGSDQIRSILARLIEKGLVAVVHSPVESNHGKSSYVLEPLWDRLLTAWQKSKTKKLGIPSQSDSLKKVYGTFEKEFGRYLSPIESSKIVQWCSTDGFSSEIILEALERSVLQGVLSFKYIDSILKTWETQNLKTIEEINNYEKKYKERRKNNKNSNPKQNQKLQDKYSEIYVT